MKRTLFGLLLTLALTSCIPMRGPSSQSEFKPGKLRRKVVHGGRLVVEERLTRDTRLPFSYEE